MRDFKKPGGFGGGNRDFKKRDFGGRPSFGGGRSPHGNGPARMFTAVCAECHKECEVPFRPDGRKPVYCSDCFGSRREAGPTDYGRREFSQAPSPRPQQQGSDGANFELKSQIDRLSSKLDKVIELMQKISPVTPAPAPVTEKKVEKTVVPAPVAKKVEKAAAPAKEVKKKVEKVVAKKKPAKKTK